MRWKRNQNITPTFPQNLEKYIRQICHLSIDDLKAIDKQNRMPDGRPNCFIANKFDFNVDSGAIICMARRLHSQEYVRENLLH